jgi:polyribonucleotide nucleotidyltransferase
MEQSVLETVSLEIGGRTLVIETGEVAKQANGSAVVRYGDANVVLAAVTISQKPREGIDFFPLTCEFEEKMYAAGKIPGGYIKREGRPTEHATLSARQIDRPIRPLFPDGFRNDVQIVTTVLSIDRELDADVLAVCAAGAALAVSDCPFHATVAAVRIGKVDGQLVCNPTIPQYEEGGMEIVVAGTADGVMMVEGSCKEISEEDFLAAVAFAHEEIKKIVDGAFAEWVRKTFKDDVAKAMRVIEKSARSAAFDKLSKAAAIERAGSADEAVRKQLEDPSDKQFDKIVKAMQEEELRVMVVDEGMRPDGRKADEIRPIWSKTHYVPRVHGSGLFTRGQTQVFTAATLGSISDEQRLDWIIDVPNKRYMHFYNFPSFSVGETRPMRGGAAGRGRLPVHAAPDERNPRIERFVVDGVGLRIDLGAHGRRRSDQEARRGDRDGPHLAWKEARDPQ